jgi:hypothetical protein
MNGGPGSGKGGEGGEWTDEETARLRRICEKTRALNCNDYSRCEEIFRYAFFGAPYCGPLAEAMLDCLDTRATIEDFACFGDVPFVIDRGIENPCNLEYRRVGNAYCFG